MMNTNGQPTNRQPTKSEIKGVTALYSRLSREDSLDGDSLSIQNQRHILLDYADKQGFVNTAHYVDDGTSGVRFEREAWQRLVADVEAGKVSTILCKNLDRIGRDHVQVGMYLEPFRRNGVRFIAISNGVDSSIPETLEFAPFLNIMAEWFARDTSRKIKTVAHARGNSGKPLSYNAVYGYKKSAEDKHFWVVDEPAAQVVRRIFQMAMDGMGPSQIARMLTEEKVEKPSVYITKTRRIGDKPIAADLSDPYTWQGSTVAKILGKEEYCGHVVNFRTFKESYKDKSFKWNDKEDWKIFHNVHEPIIDQEVFDTVQKLRGTPRRVDKLGEANPLTGLVFCKDCGAKMYNSRQSKEYYEESRRGKTYRHKTSDHYNCSTYVNIKGYSGKKSCTAHFIRTAVIRELVLDLIKRVSEYVRFNEAEFVEKIREVSTVKQAETAKAHKKQLAVNDRRIAELDRLFQKVYEDNANLKLSDERYAQLSATYEQEQRDLREQSARLQTELDAFTEDSQKADSFIDIVKRYTIFDELTTPMLNEFVRRVEIHEADKSSGERVQKIAVHFNFIGNFELPKVETPPPTAEELEEQEKRRRRLEYQREANKRWYAKKKREADWQRALEAGEISEEELEAHRQEQLAKEESEKEEREKRTQEKRDYAREWAKKRRERLKAEREEKIQQSA